MAASLLRRLLGPESALVAAPNCGGGSGRGWRRLELRPCPRSPGRRRVPRQRPHHRLPVLPRLAADADGDFVVAWVSSVQDGATPASTRSATARPAAARRRVPCQQLPTGARAPRRWR